jgi:hypothetical protein
MNQPSKIQQMLTIWLKALQEPYVSKCLRALSASMPFSPDGSTAQCGTVSIVPQTPPYPHLLIPIFHEMPYPLRKNVLMYKKPL